MDLFPDFPCLPDGQGTMRESDAPVHYLVGTPKGRLTKLEKSFLGQPWQAVRPRVEVKLLAEEGELYVLVHSESRVLKERGMRRRPLGAQNRECALTHEHRGTAAETGTCPVSVLVGSARGVITLERPLGGAAPAVVGLRGNARRDAARATAQRSRPVTPSYDTDLEPSR